MFDRVSHGATASVMALLYTTSDVACANSIVSVHVFHFAFLHPAPTAISTNQPQANNESFPADCGSLSASFKAKSIVQVGAIYVVPLCCVHSANLFPAVAETCDEKQDREFSENTAHDFDRSRSSAQCVARMASVRRVRTDFYFRFGVAVKSSFVGGQAMQTSSNWCVARAVGCTPVSTAVSVFLSIPTLIQL